MSVPAWTAASVPWRNLSGKQVLCRLSTSELPECQELGREGGIDRETITGRERHTEK